MEKIKSIGTDRYLGHFFNRVGSDARVDEKENEIKLAKSTGLLSSEEINRGINDFLENQKMQLSNGNINTYLENKGSKKRTICCLGRVEQGVSPHPLTEPYVTVSSHISKAFFSSHSFVTLAFAGILAEARKYGLSLFLAHQYIRTA